MITRRVYCLNIFFVIAVLATLMQAQESLREAYPHDDFTIREERICMRDGVELYTLILTPKEQSKPLPILIERTPYNATRLLGGHPSARLAVAVGTKFMGMDYIYVAQDIRGRFKSDGDYETYRVPRGSFNPTETDETTDAWDTIDWLVNHVPNNGRVGIWGTSYPGWLSLAAMRDPHPALAAAVPFNPVVDVWKADDWFHWGAFRADYAFAYIYDMETRHDESTPFPYPIQDTYAWMLTQGAAGLGLSEHMDDRHQMWQRIMSSPSYGPYWQDVAADQWFEDPPRLVPALHVHGYWDQEDIYGAPAVYTAIETHDTNNNRNFFAAGPWYHGQHFKEGTTLGSLDFDQDTAKRFRQEVLEPFLRHFLHGDLSKTIAPVTVFETGANRWREFDQWPPGEPNSSLYLQPEGGLGFSAPLAESSATSFVSDPAKPVPYAPRPTWTPDYGNPPTIAAWQRWLVEDQRFVDGRPDVVTWVSEPLEEALTIRGPVTAELFASTTGQDADWVVKLIDVYPDDDPEFVMSGFQLMVSGDIFRGRYRTDYEQPQPLQPSKVLRYEIPLPHVNHTFLPGHRLMVQIQSTWFPLYDRNPQTWVESIMVAPPEAYQAQTHAVHHDRQYATRLRFYGEQ
ncbi:CocE/NonD family hydrolase [candidate division KSB1 bacterium]|nr:CocE/NonD family hydrolase [candidate division KSB1 bacterium]